MSSMTPHSLTSDTVSLTHDTMRRILLADELKHRLGHHQQLRYLELRWTMVQLARKALNEAAS